MMEKWKTPFLKAERLRRQDRERSDALQECGSQVTQLLSTCTPGMKLPGCDLETNVGPNKILLKVTFGFLDNLMKSFSFPHS